MMKKTIFKLVIPVLAFFGIAFMAKGQKIKNALGITFGYEKEFGGGVSYQRRIFDTNRLEFVLGLRDRNYTGTTIHEIKLSSTYQWFWNIPDGYVFYAGLGFGVGHWYYGISEKEYSDNGNYTFLTGQVGIEYNFEYIPFAVSLDCKPEYINNWWRENNHFLGDLSFAIRYKF